MGKIKASQILVRNARIEVIKLKPSDVREMIESTRKKQDDLRKLKDVDQEKLKLVVQV